MAYRSRFNINDPRFQAALRNASKGDSAIQGASAEERGIYSHYGQTEGARLSSAEQRGRRLKHAEKDLEFSRALNKARLGLRRQEVDFQREQGDFSNRLYSRRISNEKDKLRDATIGSILGLGIGAADVGLNIYSSNKHREMLEQDKVWNEMMKRRWAMNNPSTAYYYGSTHPELGISSYIPRVRPAVAGRMGHEAFRLSKY